MSPTDFPDIIHHGAVNGVTGSSHQLVINSGNSILVDCGLFQGAEISAQGADNIRRITVGRPGNHCRFPSGQQIY